jgi:hypothetical protein
MLHHGSLCSEVSLADDGYGGTKATIHVLFVFGALSLHPERHVDTAQDVITERSLACACCTGDCQRVNLTNAASRFLYDEQNRRSAGETFKNRSGATKSRIRKESCAVF